MSWLLVLPVALPLFGAATCLAFWNRLAVQRCIALVVALILLAAAAALLSTVSSDGIQVIEVGSWPAPVGIVLVADLFSAIMLCLAAIIGLAVVVYSLASIDSGRTASGYYPLLLVLLTGVSGSFLTGDFFNLYVWFEVMLMSSFVLLALGGGSFQIEGALKYVSLNILSSAFFLTTLGLLYSFAGTVNFADLAVVLRESSNGGMATTLAVLFLVAFGIKAALFPFFFWLPASYHAPPVAVSAIFAGLLTKVGVYALIRVFTLLFTQDVSYTHGLILVLSALTMVTGVLGAVAQNEFRKVLSFHIVSQIGYMTMGLGLFSTLGLAGAIYYIIHHIIVKTNLFLVSGIVHRMRGTFDLKLLGGLHGSALVAVLFLIPAMSLAGIPPLSGFWAKLALVQAGLADRQYEIVAVSLVVGFLTLYSMAKIWNEAFAKPPPFPVDGPVEKPPPLLWLLPSTSLAALTVLLGLGAGPMLDLSMQAAEQLLNPDEYVSAVLGRPVAE